uniref:ADP-ribosylation factor-like protein 14 n=1 Tax=Salvator merianae TaxID=96440 RepID=A0A8D0B031_SALMN
MGHINSKQMKRAQISMLGLDSAGKSTLLYKLKFNDVFLTSPTIGFNVEMIETRENIALTIWDVGGQQKMRTAWTDYLENTDCLVYVVDSTDESRLEESKKELGLILKNDQTKNIPVVIVANKQDLRGAMSAEEITRRLNIKKYCHDRNWYVQPCCAVTGQGVSEAFQKMTSFAKSCTVSLCQAREISVWERASTN